MTKLFDLQIDFNFPSYIHVYPEMIISRNNFLIVYVY